MKTPGASVVNLVLIAFLTFTLFQAEAARAQAAQFARAPGKPIEVGRGCGPIRLIDVNHDGHLDLITKHLTNRMVSVLLGDGHSGFVRATKCSMKLDFEPAWLAVTNLSENTTALAVASKERSNEIVRVFLGDEQGHFHSAPELQFSVPASEYGYKPMLEFVDLNEDGNADLISANGRRGSMEIYFGDGRSGFRRGSTVKLESGSKMRSFGIGEIDGDGHLDLATTTSSSPPQQEPGRLAIRRGDGQGGFADAGTPPILVPPDPNLLVMADINGDGRSDIVLGHGRTNIVTVLLNDGKGGFGRSLTLPFASGMSAYAAACADLNGDNQRDLVISTVKDSAPYDSKIVVLLGDGRGGFTPASGSPYDAEPGAYTVAMGDFNKDGKLDIAASSFESSVVTILLGQ